MEVLEANPVVRNVAEQTANVHKVFLRCSG